MSKTQLLPLVGLVTKSCPTLATQLLQPNGLGPARLLCPWDSPGKNTGAGCHALLQGIFLIQALNPRLLHWQADSLSLSPQGSSLAPPREHEDSKDVQILATGRPQMFWGLTKIMDLIPIKSHVQISPIMFREFSNTINPCLGGNNSIF